MGKKVCPQVTLLCVYAAAPLQWSGGDTGYVQQCWCVPGGELFLSMGCVCWGGIRGFDKGPDIGMVPTDICR